MTEVICESEKTTARRKKKALFWSWFACCMATLLVVGALIGIEAYLVGAKRDRSYTFLLAFLSALLAFGFMAGSLFFFSIKYRLTRKYVRMLRDMEQGLKDTIEGKFLRYDDEISTKDGVFFYTMVLKTRPLRRDDIDERKLLVEQTIPKIALNEGDRLKIVSHANILVAYEIVERAPQQGTAIAEGENAATEQEV